MNKIHLVTAVALVFASAVIMIGSGSIQSAHACSGSGTAAQNANPTTPSNLNAQLPPPSSSSPLAAGQTA